MKKLIIPSLANISGFAVGVLAAYSLSFIGSIDHGQYRFYSDFAVRMADRYEGLDVITASAIMGAIIALIISFIVTHIVEKVLEHVDAATRD